MEHQTDIMMHPAMPLLWGASVWVFMLAAVVWYGRPVSGPKIGTIAKPIVRLEIVRKAALFRLPVIGAGLRYAMTRPYVLFACKVLSAGLFLLVIAAGLTGTPVADQNFATVLTWNVWWAGLIVSIFFFGTAWCAVCPWDAIATWLVHRRPWGRGDPNSRLHLRVPKWLRSVWPALFLFIVLTWLELGIGVTVDPYATALLALVMILLATASLLIFKRKAFCRYFCPVGRTVGFYAQLAPVELRTVDPDICARCTTLECYYGNDAVEPCPTNLVMGRLKQNTYCTSCGNCAQSCPSQNVTWRLRPTGTEAAADARPHWDVAWFMLVLLALTGFHGITMTPQWEPAMIALARGIGDSSRMTGSFSIALLVNLAVPVLLFIAAVAGVRCVTHRPVSFKKYFIEMAPVALPLAFTYHIAHNLGHLLRENSELLPLLASLCGIETRGGGTMADLGAAGMPYQILSAVQAGLLIWGFWMALKILSHRGVKMVGEDQAREKIFGQIWPMIGFAVLMTGYHVWLLSQDMVMRL